MSTLKEVFYRIQYLDNKNERQFQKKIIKTMEELGELAAVYLEEDGYKLVEEKRTPEEIDKHKLVYFWLPMSSLWIVNEMKTLIYTLHHLHQLPKI